jgi:aminopeptidase N
LSGGNHVVSNYCDFNPSCKTLGHTIMKNFFRVLTIVLLPVSLIYSQDFREDLIKSERTNFKKTNRFSKIEYPGDSTINVTYYKLNLTLNYDTKYLNGIVTVSFKSESSNLTSLFLDLQNSMIVDSVKMNGTNINFSQPAGQAELVINLPSAMSLGEQASVDVFYGGNPVSSGFGSFAFGNDGSGGKAIYTLSEPYGARDWWPCKDTPADKADSSDVWITVENGLTAVSNGTLQEVVGNRNGTRTFKWKNSYPIAQYLISLAVANYLEYDTYYKYNSTDSMLISNYIWQNSYNSNTTQALDLVADMIKILSDRYGPYPFIKEKYGHAQFGWGGGMEHQTITSVGGFNESLEIHELAHQWFGDKVTCKTWNDIWLNEGFATYSEGVYYEGKYGRQLYDSFIYQLMSGVKKYQQNSVYVNDISSIDNIFSSTSYLKGGLVLHMLRGIVGDSTFFRIMKTYNSDPRYAYNSASTSDFQGVAESVSGLDLSYFFNEWIYGVDYPRYSYNWSYLDIGGGFYKVTLNIDQPQRTNPQFFTMPVQIKITTSTGDTAITVFNNKLRQQFDISVNGMPLQLAFDPDNYILKESTLTDLPDKIIPREFQLEQNYPNPFNPVTVIKYYIPHITRVKLTITDGLGRLVKTLVNKEQTSGQYSVTFDGKQLASGIYFYTLSTDKFIQTKKMILLK